MAVAEQLAEAVYVEFLPDEPPRGFTVIQWTVLRNLAISPEAAMTIRQLALKAFPGVTTYTAESRINTVLSSNRLEELCQKIGSELHIIEAGEFRRGRQIWRDPVGLRLVDDFTEPEFTSEVLPFYPGGKKPYLPQELRLHQIHIGEKFRGLSPITADELDKRYPLARRMQY